MDASSNNGPRVFKRKKRKSVIQQAKRYGAKGLYGRGTNLPEDTFKYLFRVLEMSRNNFETFETTEEKALFVDNSLCQMEGEEVNYSCNQLGCRVIETLLPHAGDPALLAFMTAFTRDLRPLVTDRFASHVLQKLVGVAGERGQAWDAWVVKCGAFVMNNLEDFVWDQYGCHVVRTCLTALAAVEGGEGKREVVEEVARRLMMWPQFEDLPYANLTSGLLQALLLACHATSKKTLSALVKKLHKKCFSYVEEEDATATPDGQAGSPDGQAGLPDGPAGMPHVFTHEAASRLLDVAIGVASPKRLGKIYVDCFKGRLAQLSQMSLANHQVQNLFKHWTDKEALEDMFNELSPAFEDILRVKNTGVLLSLAQACQRLSTKQQPFQQQLLRALHCSEPADLPHVPLCVARLSPPDPQSTVPLSLHGTLVLQTLLTFSKPIAVVNSLLATSDADLTTLLTDLHGCHVMDAYMTSCTVGEKSREKMWRKLRGGLVSLACNKAGSRSLDAVWNVSSLAQKAQMLTELGQREAQLNGNQFGKILAANYQLALFRHRPDDWRALQSAGGRKRKLFQNIIGDLDKKSKLCPTKDVGGDVKQES